MNINFLEQYIGLNKQLARTLTIKSSISADSYNEYLKVVYGKTAVDDYDKTSWKYYKNIAGVYHQTDEPMIITSLDTLEDIIFSKESLAIHTTTLEEYQYGTRYYFSLLSRYPNQEQLILGILYPCDITKAITAEDGTVLSYPSKLIEEQEMSLIPELEVFIKNFLIRWNVKSFSISDSLYNTAQHAILYLSILPKLLNIRLSKCKTYEAHSFHITEYLASHGGLDKYMPFLSMRQKLYLYRNIRYIERNSGKTELFKELVDRLLTEKLIPLSEYSIRHLVDYDTNYYPEVNIRRNPINVQYNAPELDYLELNDLFKKESLLSYGNQAYLEKEKDNITHTLQIADTSVIQSKDLESTMVDYADAVPDKLDDILLRQWIFMSFNGLYDAVISFQDPFTFETRVLRASDAFIYMYYLTLKSENILIETIPDYLNYKVLSGAKPTVDKLLSIADPSFKLARSYAQTILNKRPDIVRCRSKRSFFNLCKNIYEFSQYCWFLTSNVQDLYERGYVENMIYQLYSDREQTFPQTGLDFNTWLKSRNLPEYNYGRSEGLLLIETLFNAATGRDLDDSKSLTSIQGAMLNIIAQLSSYSIQFIKDINASGIKPINWSAIRVGNPHGYIKGSVFVNNEVLVNDHKAKLLGSVRVPLLIADSHREFKSKIKGHAEVTTRLEVTTKVVPVLKSSFNLPAFVITATYAGKDENISSKSIFIDHESFLNLSLEQKRLIKDIYSES